jgi:phosphatidylserine/phosphatidylglycerophosphate/cardiolipin synthase-like enzyme
MALILQIFLHSRKSQSKSIKSQNQLKKKQNNGQLVLVAVDATSGPAHIKIFIKAISSAHDEVALINAKTGN